MKRILLLVAFAVMASSCLGGGAEKKSGADAETTKAQSKVYTLETLLADAENLVDKAVEVKGVVTHTCKHSGRRCFIQSADQKTTLRIEAAGENLQSFPREVVGSEILAKGTLRERRLTSEYIDRWEDDVKEKMGKEDGSVESCAAETNNINAMREWMKSNNKDYYSIFYMDGESYEVVE